MGAISALLDIGKKGMAAHQTAIGVAGHNIVNVNTEGYTRQVVSLTSSSPTLTGGGYVGTGVDVANIRRNYDSFIEKRLAYEMASQGQLDSLETSLEKVESVLNESAGVGLSNNLAAFFNSMEDLANNPGGFAERITVRAQTENLIGTFNSLSTSLDDLQSGLDGEVRVLVKEINDITTNIADMNTTIRSLEIGGKSANDFLDKRTQLIKDLSERIDISYFEAGDGSVSIQGVGGFLLVNDTSSYDLSVLTNLSGHLDVYSNAGTTNVTSGINGGRLGGVIQARDVNIQSYEDQLDQIAFDLAEDVNDLHSSLHGGSAAYGLVDLTQNDFFTTIAAVSGAAGNISLDASIVSDVNNIAAAQNADLATGLPGDNTNALAIADLRTSLTMSGGTATYDEYYGSLISSIGNDLQGVSTQLVQQDGLISQLELRRESTSGVSLDEEMTDLVKLQHTFEATARLINIADEMLTTVLGLIR